MEITYSHQYQAPCIEVTPDDTLSEVLLAAEDYGAYYYDGESKCIVVDFKYPDRQVGPELYTVSALSRSMTDKV